MPTGFPDSLTPVARLLEWLQPGRVLDIGVGGGRMGFLAREYGHVPWHPRAQGDGVEVDGIEGYEPYLGPVQRAVYDRLIVADALSALDELASGGRRYDLVLASDVIEHFAPEDGRRLIEACLEVGDLLLVGTPRAFFEQASDENELENHRSHWPERELRRAGARAIVHRGETLVALFGDAETIAAYEATRRRPLRARLRAAVREVVR